LSHEDAMLLTSIPAVADYFEECARNSGNPRAAANWAVGDLTYALKASGKGIEESPVSARELGVLIRTIDSGEISGKIAKTVFEEMFRSGEGSAPVIRRLGLVQISDEPALLGVIEKVKAANPRQLADYRSGKDKLFGYFVGQVMKETQGQANPKVLNELLQKALRE